MFHIPNNAKSGKVVCPRCGELAPRVPRTLCDRLVSLFKQVKRYRCDFCDWEASLPAYPEPLKTPRR